MKSDFVYILLIGLSIRFIWLNSSPIFAEVRLRLERLPNGANLTSKGTFQCLSLVRYFLRYE